MNMKQTMSSDKVGLRGQKSSIVTVERAAPSCVEVHSVASLIIGCVREICSH